MPTAEYYQAIKILNSKCENNWVTAMEMCSEEEKKFITESIGGEKYVQDGFKEITLRKCEDGFLRRHHNIYKFHPTYPSILVSNNGRVFKIRDKVYEDILEVTYTVNRTRRSTYNHSGNPTVSILGMPVLVKNLIYDTFVGDRKKRDVILNINGDKRDNRLSNLKIETPLDRLMSHDLYPHLDKIIEMRKQKITFEKMSDILGVNVSALKHFVQKARKLGVIE